MEAGTYFNHIYDVMQGLNKAQRNQRSNNPFSNDQNDVMESMNRACKYSPEEKKERIERYRSKRIRRNFNKNIKVHISRSTLKTRVKPNISLNFISIYCSFSHMHMHMHGLDVFS